MIFSEHLLTDMNTTVVIENATFYSVPDENWLNCSRGPLGPLAMGGLASSEVELGSLGRHQQSIFAGVSGFSSLTNVRYVVLMQAPMLFSKLTRLVRFMQTFRGDFDSLEYSSNS